MKCTVLTHCLCIYTLNVWTFWECTLHISKCTWMLHYSWVLETIHLHRRFLCTEWLNAPQETKKRSQHQESCKYFPRVCVCNRKNPTATRAERITVSHYSLSKTAQDASLTLSRTSLGLTLPLPVATPVVTKAMICQSVFISSSGHVPFAWRVNRAIRYFWHVRKKHFCDGVTMLVK